VPAAIVLIPRPKLSESTINTIDKVNQSLSSGHNWTWENTIAYSFNKGQHSFNALIGQSLEKWGMGESLNVTNGYSLFDDFAHAWIDNTQNLTSGVTTLYGSPWGEGGIASFFSRVNYDYKETYMLSAVMRADGSSNFAASLGIFSVVSPDGYSNESFCKTLQLE
jgi:hypothetical protein